MLKHVGDMKKAVSKGAITLTLVLLCGIFIFGFQEHKASVSEEITQSSMQQKKSVLFISSYSESFITVDLQKQGIHDVFDKKNIQVDIEYMDMKNYDTAQNANLFYQRMQYKILHHPKYDAILLGDDAALRFAMTYQKELFPEIPMVFLCVNEVPFALTAGENPYITGAVEKFYLKDTINTALKFQPAVRNIVAIYDDTLTGQGDRVQFYALKKNYPDCSFTGIDTSEISHTEFGSRLDAIAGNSIIIYLDNYEDADGKQYGITDSVGFIVKHARVPVYRPSIGGVGEGLIGGKMVSYDDSGRVAAEMVVKILKGANVADIPVQTEGVSKYYFDENVLRKFKISDDLLPKDAVVVNRPATFYERYQKAVIPATIIGIICILALMAVILDNMRQRRLSRELRSSHEALKMTYEKLMETEEKLEQQYLETREYIRRLEEKEECIQYQAEHDYLTNLPNRRAAMSAIDRSISRKEKVTIMLLDIDDFKEINDTDGHVCGDMVLTELAERLIKLEKEEKIYVSRFGGDEFLIIVPGINQGRTEDLIDKIKQLFTKTFVLNGTERKVRSSIGIVCAETGMEKTGDLIANADLALYSGKRSGKNASVFYHSDMKNKLIEKNRMEMLLGQACEEDGFTILYQPQIELRTGKTNCYEALVRLKGNRMSPAMFIPVAEESGQIVAIGRIVTEKVIEQMVLWREHGMTQRPVSINFSSRQMEDAGYVSYLKGLLSHYDISPEMIEIEITESILIKNNEKAMKLFDDFVSIGVSLVLDDFGTGYSSINYLTYIPVQKIKLDKLISDNYLQDGKEELIENIIRLIHSLGLKITVEGIEQEHQVERLRKFSCDYIQGYIYSKPVSGLEIEKSGL